MRKILRAALILFAAILPLHGADESQRLPEELAYGVPGVSDLQLNRKGFSIGYSMETRQAVWVCYILTEEHLSGDRVKRQPRFLVDPAVHYRPVRPKDYTRTGFDRGHLVPAADMAYSVETMRNSFYMTNISPQLPGCNRGIWKRLEEQVRQWAVREKSICIVSGPVFLPGPRETMGDSGIPVPAAFFKVVLDLTPPKKMIGFIIPNNASKKSLRSFAVSVDSVEKVTGLDFFSELPDDEEEMLESACDFELWEHAG